jgi:hypothetical protein
MTEVFERANPDAEELIIAWLVPLGRTSIERRTGDELPFRLVTGVAGDEDPDLEIGAAVVSVHTLCARSDGSVAARNEAALTHQRMLELKHLDTITLVDGTDVSVDYMRIFQPPLWLPYGDDQILRKVGRYRIGLSYVPTELVGS